MNEIESGRAPAPDQEGAEAENQGDEFDEAWQPRLWSKLILLLVFVGYGIALVVANSSKVKISFLFTSINVSKIWLILLCLVLGLVSGVLISQVHRHRKNERARLEQQAKQSK
ncbi:MAG: lipopolysaccharide assembly protein LapA domain-containing protein [Gaiellaceae bacterium]|jgi:uncharacterized integral membrane protein